MERVKLQEFMNRKGFTQKDLAEAIGVKRELVAAWNTGRSNITRENLVKLFIEGMTLEEAFGKEVAEKIGANIPKIENSIENCDSLSIVLDGLEKIVANLKNSKLP